MGTASKYTRHHLHQRTQATIIHGKCFHVMTSWRNIYALLKCFADSFLLHIGFSGCDYPCSIPRILLVHSPALGQPHDDVIKWKHFPRHCPFMRGIRRSPFNSPHKSQYHGALMFSLICAWINGWVNHREAGDLSSLWRHCDAYNRHQGPIIGLARCQLSNNRPPAAAICLTYNVCVSFVLIFIGINYSVFIFSIAMPLHVGYHPETFTSLFVRLQLKEPPK